MKDFERLIDKYTHALQNTEMPIFESETDEVTHYQHDAFKWLRDVNMTKYILPINEEKSFIFSDGNLIVVSNKNILNEGGSGGSDFASELVKFVYGPIEHVGHIFHDIKEEPNFENSLLGFSMVVEIFALVASFFPIPKVKALGIIATYLAGFGFVVGGGVQVYKGIKNASNLEYGKFDMDNFGKELSGVNEKLSEGGIHVLMGLLTMVFGYLMTGRTAAMRDAFRKSLKTNVAKGQLQSAFKHAFIEWHHTVPHLAEHYLAGVLALFVPASMFDEEEGKGSTMSDLKNIDAYGKKTLSKFQSNVKPALEEIKKIDLTVRKVDSIGDLALSILQNTTILGAVGVTANIVKNTFVGLLENIMDWVIKFANWNLKQIAATADFFTTIHDTALRYDKLFKKNNIDKIDVETMINGTPRKTLDSYKGKKIELNYKSKTGDKRTEEFMNNAGPSAFMTKTAQSSTSVSNKYPAKLENFPSFDDFTKQNINENVMNNKNNVKPVKLYEEFVEMKENNKILEGFMSQAVDFSAAAVSKLRLFFNGLFMDLADFGSSPAVIKRHLLEISEEALEQMNGEISSQEYAVFSEIMIDSIIPRIKSGDIKKSKDYLIALSNASNVALGK